MKIQGVHNDVWKITVIPLFNSGIKTFNYKVQQLFEKERIRKGHNFFK